MQIAFERIRRKTAPTGSGNRDGIQEVFEVIKVPAEYLVRLGNRTYRPRGRDGYFPKIDTYGSVRKPHLPRTESVSLFLGFTIKSENKFTLFARMDWVT